LKKVYDQVGFKDSQDESENILVKLKRADILSMACHLGHQECIAEASRHFQNWVQTPNPDSNNP